MSMPVGPSSINLSRSALLKRRFNSGWHLVGPLLALVTLMFGGGLANIVWLSFADPQPGLQNYDAIISNPSIARLLWTTFRVCAITTVVSVIFGYVIAYAITHAKELSRQKMLLLLLMSFWIPILVRTFSWLIVLGQKGLVNSSLLEIGLISEPLPLIRNELGVVIGMVHYMTPYAVLPLLASMQSVDERFIAASRSLGATAAQTFWRIYLPLTRAGMVAATILVFILSLGFYITPAILGGGKVLMIAEYISIQVLVLARWGIASMLAVLLLVAVFSLLILMSRFMRLSVVLGGRR